MQFKLAVSLSLQAIAATVSAIDGYPGHMQPCMDLHIVCARGSDEPHGTGIIGEIGYMVNGRVPNSNTIGLRYPATFAEYAHSELAGVRNLTEHIQNYVDRCPDSKIALLGYSQGAQVIGDTLYGNTEHGRFNHTQPLGLEYGKHIAAVVLMGDPTFQPGHSWDAGSSTRHGVFHRHNIEWAYPYAPVTRSYCDHGDVYCARGQSATAHGAYVDKYKYHASTFVVRSYHRSLRPHGGIDIARAPNRPSHKSGKNKGSEHGNHARNHRPNNHPDNHADGHASDNHNAASSLRWSPSAVSWLLLPLAIVMSF